MSLFYLSSFRGSNSHTGLTGSGINLTSVYNLIKDVQKGFRTREQEKKELEGYKEQDHLVLSSTKGNPRLKDLYMRPLIGSRRVQVCTYVFHAPHVHIYMHVHMYIHVYYVNSDRVFLKLIRMVFVTLHLKEIKLISYTITLNMPSSR